MNWYLSVLKNYAEFNGRARRTEFWMFALFNAVVTFVLEIIFISSGSWFFLILLLLYVFGVLVPGIAVAVRRMHDIGKPGVWVLVALIPFVGGIWLIVLAATPGMVGPNMYGQDPKMAVAPY